MKLNKGKRVHHLFQAATMLPTAVLSVGLTVPSQVAHATTTDPSEVVVTARRTEEVIQNVPISMTVFNQDMLNERNVTNGADLVAYTPSLNVNTRFGSDQASFAIRGFTQDLRTTASVAVYFADVVAPRGGGSVTSGDGAGPGSFFDLQNVQILKGPQGTLFGRNTTGGAIQLVPQEPTNRLEGYVEASRGNYDMSRWQGVINLPISDTVRARFGFDTERRDGYLVNQSGIGPDRFSDIDYLAGRGSVIWEITDTLQNYTIFSQTSSENNGSVQKLIACGSAQFAAECQQTLAIQGHGFYNVVSADSPNPQAKLRQWQAINTTTWNMSTDLTIKNILAYADLWQNMRGSTFGSDFSIPVSQFGPKALGPDGKPLPLQWSPAGSYPGIPTNSQTTFVEELQFQGTALNDKLNWQAGYYYEDSRPDGWSGSMSPGYISCYNLPLTGNPSTWTCQDLLGPLSGGAIAGSVERALAKIEYNNQAIYSQGTYDITDEWRATLGLRYTIDNTHAESNRITYLDFPANYPGVPLTVKCSVDGLSISTGCLHHMSQRSEAPTWLFDVDYLPTPDVMIYGKYSRGYRQGSLVTPAPPGLESYEPEQVDAYELGAKTSFHGFISGTFNIALFYNELKGQQLQVGYLPKNGGSATTAIENANSSKIQGIEVESMLKLTKDLTFNLGYTYLETRLNSLDAPITLTDSLGRTTWQPIPSAAEGSHLTFSPRHTVTTGLSYRLPLPAEVGDVSAGTTYTFTAAQTSSATDPSIQGSPYAELGARQLLNFNLGWKAIYGSAFDASFFMTNALNEKYYSYVAGLYTAAGAEPAVTGEPKMWGARIKYNFQ